MPSLNYRQKWNSSKAVDLVAVAVEFLQTFAGRRRAQVVTREVELQLMNGLSIQDLPPAWRLTCVQPIESTQ
jgi:hypothetical protein